METLLPLLAGGALGGIAVGVFSGMLGIGGGTLMIPLFRLAFGLSPLEATATSLFCVVPTSLSGAVQHIRSKTSLLKLGITAGVAGALTSPLGVRLAQASPEWLVMLAAAIIITWSAAKMFSKARKMPKARATTSAKVRSNENGVSELSATAETAAKETAAAGTGPASTAPQSVSPAKSAQGNAASTSQTLTRKQLLQGALIGLGAGLASGYVGVGGGFLMVPLFLSVIGATAHQASGTSLVAVMILAVPGVVQQGLLGNIAYAVGIATCVGSIPGAVLGARLATRIPERTLRFAFGYFLLLAAALLMVNELGIL